MASLELTLFGPCQIARDGTAVVHVESNKVRALLAFLVLEHHHPRARDGLADLLWPDFPANAARSNFRRTLASLRSTIGDRNAQPPHLFITRETVQFNLDSDVAVDAVQFIDLAKTPRTDPDWRGNLAKATDLYGGAFLEGLDLPDCPEYEHWMTTARSALEQLAARSLLKLALYDEQQGAVEKALSRYRRCMTLDPYDEAVQRGLMRTLTVGGHRNTAIQEYAKYCSQLTADLGVEPEHQTVELFRDIQQGNFPSVSTPFTLKTDLQAQVEPATTDLAGRCSNGAGARNDPLAQTSLPVSSGIDFPLPHTPLIGREAELEQIAACLADPACRLLTIVGPGGVGKSRLAGEAVAGQKRHFVDGVHFVSLAAVTQADAIAEAILFALDAPIQYNVAIQSHLLGTLHDKQILLVLDNFEHLLDAARLLPVMLDASPGLKLMVTSCERLNLRDEWLVPIKGLALPPTTVSATDGAKQDSQVSSAAPLAWEELERYSAIQLFLYGVRRLRPDFKPSSADTDAILGICQLLGGLPLGIELATAWTRMLSFSAILDGMRHSLDFLTANLQDLPSRHRSLRAVFDHAWRILNPRQRSLLCRLAALDNSLAPETVAAVTGASMAELADLVDRSWLYSDSGDHLALHELGRRYLTEMLETEYPGESGEDAGPVRSDHYTDHRLLLPREAIELHPPLDMVEKIEYEWSNMKAA